MIINLKLMEKEKLNKLAEEANRLKKRNATS